MQSECGACDYLGRTCEACAEWERRQAPERAAAQKAMEAAEEARTRPLNIAAAMTGIDVSREEKAAIYAASGLPQCDPNRVTEGFERAADLLEPFRDPTLEPLQRPQEPQ